MRILDIGVATVYALLCISVISMTNPHSSAGEATLADRNHAADSALLRYIRSVGLNFLGSAPPSEVCSSLQSASNGTLELAGQVGGTECRGPPPLYDGFSSMVLKLSDRRLVIEAWVVER